MIRCVSVAAAVAAAVPVLLLSGMAQAGDEHNQDGQPGEAGTGTATCHSVPPTEDGVLRCSAVPGDPGAAGSVTDD
jgi:hypothetical protein